MAFDPDARLADWRKSLLDTTKRNRLIKFVAGRIGGVYLFHPPPADLWAKLVRDGATLSFAWKWEILGLPPEVLDAEALAADFDPASGKLAPDADVLARALTQECVKSPHLGPKDVLTEFPDRLLAARLLRLYQTAKVAATEHGVTTLYAAFGFLRWYESPDSDEELLSPLLLVPVRLDRQTVESEFTLRAEEDDVLPNYCLAELLRTQFRIALPSATDVPLEVENPECLPRYLAAVAERVAHVPRWGVVDSAALGVFNFQKLAMWEDLGRNADRVKTHPVCRAIAGDAAATLAPPADLPVAGDLDRVVPPEAALHILDADSSQHEAIEAVKRGAHLVMDGPPGTGKSQTIANIIAEALAAGKRVLFVSEKTAALDVVKRRLDRCRLGDFCLELHSHKANKREVVAELGQCLGLTSPGVPDTAARVQELASARRRVNEFVAELHAVREPLGWSAFRVHGELAQLAQADRTPGRSRLAIPDVFAKSADYVRRGAEILARLADCRAVLEEPGGHPWRGCKVTAFTNAGREDIEYLLGRLSDVTVPAVRAAEALTNLGFVSNPPTVPNWRAAEADARRVLSAPVFPAEWFRGNPRVTAEALVGLDAAAREARELARRLPEFAGSLVHAIAEPAAVAELSPERARLADAGLSARERLAALGRVEEKLRALSRVAGDVEPAARTAAGLLQTSGTPGADQMLDLAGVAAEIGDGPPIPPRWWEARRRADLLEALARGEEEERLAQAQLPALLAKLDPEALAPQSLATVMEAERRGGSFWQRLLPRWWKLKKKVAGWYVTAPPSSSALRADVAELATYHRRVVAVRQIAAQYSTELSTVAKGEPDWAATAARVRAVEWLDRAGVQHTFKAAKTHRAFDHPALGQAADRLRRLATALGEGWDALQSEFVVPDAPARFARPVPELAAWLAAEADGCRAEAAALSVLVSALLPGKDIAAAELPQRAADLRQLVDARARMLVAAALLRDARPPHELEAADHSADAERARALQEVLAGLGRPVSPPVVAALTAPAVREKLAAAQRQSENARRAFDKAWDKVTADLFDPGATVSTNLVLNETPLPELGKWAGARATDGARLAEWTIFVRVEREAAEFGVAPVLEEVRGGEFPAAAAANAFRVRFYRLWLDALQQKVPVLAGFVAETHDRLVARFAELDRVVVRTTAERVRGQLLESPTRPRMRDGAPDTSELGILLREVNKKRRHLPLRHLFRQIPTILLRLKPCLMMSPLAVSAYLDSPELTFDLVIFDEASQVRPHDAVCAIYRGRQLVVGGDPKQLPPTDFFTRTGADEADEQEDAGTVGFESLLDVCLALGITRKQLRWHYRSRREGLIAFSNRHFYDGRLVTFPSADEATAPSVKYDYVEDGRFIDGVNVVEARRVATLVMEHARTSPDRSLGVIAFSQRQQDRILAEVETLRRQNTYAEVFFSEDRDEPFFVKNLENVQGDERDAIILGVGYGPDEAWKVAMRFGPLNREGGERRLNVAITRARHAMTVVASMTAADVDLSRTSAAGAKLLKAFLDYAQRGPVALAAAVTEAGERGAESPFEQAVGQELARRGLTVHRQVGCGGYRIDIAIADPQRGGKYVLGVECDGATYHSAATARDRDRLRQMVLEGLGWRLLRVWSGEWVRDREKQVRRILAAVDPGTDTARGPRPSLAEPEQFQLIRPRAPRTKSVEYDSIESVPEAALSDAITAALTEFGSMPAEDLIATVTKRLGFKRTGPRIRERLTETLNTRIAAGTLAMSDDGRVRIPV
jgi:very-short-patch-repair endonuclease